MNSHASPEDRPGSDETHSHEPSPGAAESKQGQASDAGTQPESQESQGDEASASSTPGSTPLSWWRYQREGSAPKTAQRPAPAPKPSRAPTPPPAAAPVESRQADSGPTETPVGKEPAGETPSAAAPGKETQGTESRGKRKRDRSQGQKPQVEEPRVTRVVPTPSRRDPLTPELEQEIAAALGDASLDQILAGTAAAQAGERLEMESRHRATVVKVHRDSVFFTLGGNHEGAAPVRQFAEPPEPGQELDVVVKGFQAEDGLYELAVPGASIDVSGWSDLSEGAVVEARVTAANTGGLECVVNNIRGFIPVSQVALYRVEDLASFVDQKMQCVVLEADPMRRNLVLSRRAVLEREQEESRRRLMEELEVGQTREGVVRNIRDFGAFVDLGGVDGLIHVSQMSWDRVKHPSEVLHEGQKVQVKVDKIDRQTGKISLSYRDLLENPWAEAVQHYPAGSIVPGTVSRLANFGAFVKLGPGVEGLIHISEVAHQRVRSVGQVLKEGQEIQVKVLSVDPDAQRIALSLKAVQAAPDQAAADEAEDEAPRELAVPKRIGPLKGGTDRPSGGDQFGLKW